MRAVKPRYAFFVDNEIEKDIIDVYRENPDEAAAYVALIEELHGDQKLCERICDEHYQDDTISSVKLFSAVQSKGYNAYTVRLWEVARWRVITAIDHRQRIVGIVYIMRRDEDYDNTVQRRVISACERLAISRMGRP